MKKVTETNTDAVKDPQPSASASTPKSAKSAKLRSVVRDSLGAGPQHPGRSHRGEGDESTTSGGGDDS
jgi:hypothetical protein